MTQPDSLTDSLNPLIAALQRGHYLLYCQRIEPLDPVNSATRPFQEILIRFLEEEARLLSPGMFFAVLEDQGLMSLLDCWVVSQVLKLQQIGIDSAPHWLPPRNSINLSPDSVSDPDFVKFVVRQIDKWQPSEETLCFEVVEAVALENQAALFELVAALGPRGCSFALGGFNGSKEGLELLARLPANFVKIDGGLVQKIDTRSADRARVESIQRFAKDLGMETVAELVESEAVLAVLRDIGVDYAQGFGISLPAPFLSTEMQSEGTR